MWKFILRRILIMIPQLFVLSVIIFALAKAMPGDALTGAALNPNIDPTVLAHKRAQLGLDDPMWVQYGRWVKDLFHGNLGISYIHKIPVTQLIGHRAENSAVLGAATLFLAYLIAIPLGIVGGRWNDSIADKMIVGYNYVSFAMPIFVFALFLLFLFGFILGIFPTGGSVSPTANGIWDTVLSKSDHLVLPALSGALITTAGTIQYLRNEIIDTKFQDFVKTARSKGVPESKVYNRHILRNSLLPIAAFMGYEITGLIGGAVFVETIFSYPGIGQLFIQSIDQRDFSVVTALVLLFGMAALVGTMLSDIILSIVDPRIRID